MHPDRSRHERVTDYLENEEACAGYHVSRGEELWDLLPRGWRILPSSACRRRWMTHSLPIDALGWRHPSAMNEERNIA